MPSLACPCCGYKPEAEKARPKFDDARSIVEQIAGRYSIGVRELMSSDRSRRLIRPRWHAYFALREAGFSYPAIGEIMNRDHSTVMHGIRKLSEMDG